MIDRIQLLRNVGQFDSVNAGAQLPFARMTLIYAENGRGKTTLASMFRSLGNGDPSLIAERHRLTAAQPPHIVVASGTSSPMFQNGAWSSTVPEIAVFDDAFVDQNVCSGIEVAAEHRQNLHELILGAQGVALNTALQVQIDRVEQHNRDLRERGNAIPVAARGNLTVDQFCALENDPTLVEKIQTTERELSAARQSDSVTRQASFIAPVLPGFDREAINGVLRQDLPGMEEQAAAHVHAHLANLGDGGDGWVGEGVERVTPVSQGQDHEVCPFCAQDVTGIALLAHYRVYFSDAYKNLNTSIADAIKLVNRQHAGDIPAAFERSILTATQASEFWGQFTDVPQIDINTAQIALAWKEARELVLSALTQKQAAPLEPLELSKQAIDALDRYDELCRVVTTLEANLRPVNEAILVVKERAATANIAALTLDLTRLRTIEQRFSVAVAHLCNTYTAEKAAKAATETERDQAREALDQYRVAVFPAYEAAINDYLARFNAGFRLSAVTSVNIRGGSSCTYNVIINNVAVPVTADVAGAPSFRNTLSAGDRNTLALAFFFASIDRDANPAGKIVIIDDPMTSLDEHRSLSTVQETKRLVRRVGQVIVLSHSKAFLSQLWKGTPAADVTAIKIAREPSPPGTERSTLEQWNVHQDSITEHDKRHEAVTSYIAGTFVGDSRDIAEALRPILEAYVRIAYSGEFRPGDLLGPFIDKCNRRHGSATEILSPADTVELRDLLDYGNQFHHESNQAWQTVIINEREVLQFATRVMSFTRRP